MNVYTVEELERMRQESYLALATIKADIDSAVDTAKAAIYDAAQAKAALERAKSEDG